MEAFIESFSAGVDAVDSFVWGWALIWLLLGTHLFMTIRTGFIQRKIPTAIKLSVSKNDPYAEGDISQFGALTTALAATIGTGNIVGVATGLLCGGPGAIFWMWLTGVFGVATKYSETYISMKYRVKDANGRMLGGAMYALERGFKHKGLGKLLAVLFALFTAIASFGIGKVCEKLVPIMAIFYVACCLVIIGINGAYLWDAIVTIITCAFTGQAAFGGAVGSGIMLALQYGFKRGLFSNESGLGSAPLVAASAISKNPARQALVSMSGTFWDTVVICLITGLMLVTSLLANPDLAAIYNNTMLASNDLSIDAAVGIFSGGAALATACFESIPVLGPLVLVVGLLCFTYSTMLGWSQYGDRAITYLFGTKGIRPYQVVFLLFVFWGCIGGGDLVWNLSDISNALMAVPNCIAVLVLSGVIAKGTKYWIYEGRLEEEDTTPIPTVGTVDHPNV